MKFLNKLQVNSDEDEEDDKKETHSDVNCLLILPSAGFPFVKGAPSPAPPPDEKKLFPHLAIPLLLMRKKALPPLPASPPDEKKAPPYTASPPPDEKKAIPSADAAAPPTETKSSLTEKTIVKKASLKKPAVKKVTAKKEKTTTPKKATSKAKLTLQRSRSF